jgi:hypothetical protein
MKTWFDGHFQRFNQLLQLDEFLLRSVENRSTFLETGLTPVLAIQSNPTLLVALH